MIKYNREMLMFYNRLKSRTCKQKAIIAVAREDSYYNFLCIKTSRRLKYILTFIIGWRVYDKKYNF